MNDKIWELIDKIRPCFPTAFINTRKELILEPKNNIYFKLEDIESELDFKCKMIAWLSRPAHKGLTIYWQKKVRSGFNQFMDTTFDASDFSLMYTKLGNDVNRSLCVKFIESGYDWEVLGEENEK